MSRAIDHVPIFADLNDDERTAITRYLRSYDLDAGQVLFDQGDPGGELFIIDDGTVSVEVRREDGAYFQVATFSLGDFFGEMSVFEPEVRSARCRAVEKGRVLGLDKTRLEAFRHEQPQAAARIIRRVLTDTTQRLRSTSTFVSDMVSWGEAARKRAITDSLTGLYNRRFLDDAIDREVSRAKLEGTSVTLVMADLDRFHAINENHGSDAGDRIIAEVAPCFVSAYRESDMLARYGGDEFTFLVPGLPAKDAVEYADSACKAVREGGILEIVTGTSGVVTTSQGVASFPDHAKDAVELRRIADAALYRAKEQGRDRACLPE